MPDERKIFSGPKAIRSLNHNQWQGILAIAYTRDGWEKGYWIDQVATLLFYFMPDQPPHRAADQLKRDAALAEITSF